MGVKGTCFSNERLPSSRLKRSKGCFLSSERHLLFDMPIARFAGDGQNEGSVCGPATVIIRGCLFYRCIVKAKRVFSAAACVKGYI